LNYPVCPGWKILPVGLLLAVAGGCGRANSQPKAASEPRPEVQANHFDAANTGIIRGQVIWQGEIPAVAPFLVRANPIGGSALANRQIQPNPNAPVVHPQTRGLGNAVILLRGVDSTKAKPWSLPTVRVEQRDLHFHVHQGDVESYYGFVRRGDPIEMISRDSCFHSLHISGASFFTLAFPDPDQPLVRPLTEIGVVELMSAAGYYWMRAYLFVDDHPYYTRTDRDGRFVLEQVPPGKYEVVCWMPSWLEARHAREPESGSIARLFFLPPVTLVEKVELGKQESKEVRFAPASRDFQP